MIGRWFFDPVIPRGRLQKTIVCPTGIYAAGRILAFIIRSPNCGIAAFSTSSIRSAKMKLHLIADLFRQIAQILLVPLR